MGATLLRVPLAMRMYVSAAVNHANCTNFLLEVVAATVLVQLFSFWQTFVHAFVGSVNQKLLELNPNKDVLPLWTKLTIYHILYMCVLACRAAPELRHVAVRVLAAMPSSSSCERNWSAYDFIHSKRRNKLSNPRANDLIYVFSNKQLMRRQARLCKKGEHDSFVPWQWYDSASEESEQEA